MVFHHLSTHLLLLLSFIITVHSALVEVPVNLSWTVSPQRVIQVADTLLIMNINVSFLDNLTMYEQPSDISIRLEISFNESYPLEAVSDVTYNHWDEYANESSLWTENVTASSITVLSIPYDKTAFNLQLRTTPSSEVPSWKRYFFNITMYFDSETQNMSIPNGDIMTGYFDMVSIATSFDDGSVINNIREGDNTTFAIKVGPMQNTSEIEGFDLHFVKIVVILPKNLDVYNDSISVEGSDVNVTDVALMDGVMIGTIISTQWATLSFRCLVSPVIELNSNLEVYYSVEFEALTVENGQRSFFIGRSHQIVPVEATVVNGNVTYDIPDPFLLYSSAILYIPIEIPYGGLLKINIHLHDDGVPFSFIRLQISHRTNDDVLHYFPVVKRALFSESYGVFRMQSNVNPGVVTIMVSMEAIRATTAPVEVTPYIVLGSSEIPLSTFTLPRVVRPLLLLKKTVSTMVDASGLNKALFSVNILHAADSTGTAVNLVLTEHLLGFTLIEDNINVPSVFTRMPEVFQMNAKPVYSWTLPSFSAPGNLTLTYEAYFNDEDYSVLPKGDTEFPSTLQYRESPAAMALVKTASACLHRVDKFVDRFYVEHGYTVLMVIVGLVLGSLLSLLIVCCFMKTNCRQSISPQSDLKDMDEDIVDSVVLNQYDISKRSQQKFGKRRSKKERSLIDVLALDQKMKQYRRLDSMDIEDTEEIDDYIEVESTYNRIKCSALLVNIMVKNRDMKEDTEHRLSALFMKELDENDAKLENNYRRELNNILNSLAMNNRRQLGDLVGVQQQEKQRMRITMKSRSKDEREEMQKVVEEKHKMELEELAHKLALDQEEQLESMRKDYAVKRSLGIRDGQNHYLDNLTKELGPDQSGWLWKQHREHQAKLEGIQEQDVMNQKMLLEEKLARRKHLAQIVNAQEDDGNELLGTIEQQNMRLLDRARKIGILKEDEVKVMAQSLIDAMIDIKNKFDEKRIYQEKELSKDMTEKRRHLIAKKKELTESNLPTFDMKELSDQGWSGIPDPMQVIEGRHNLLARRRAELMDLENEQDDMEANELLALRAGIIHQMQSELETLMDDLCKKMKGEGMDELSIEKIRQLHHRELNKLVETQAENAKQQNASFKRLLTKNRKCWADKSEQDKHEKAQLREHEESVVRNILNNQVAMSDAERDHLMREYERQMVKMENSLTLNKLRQRKKFEKRVAKQKEEQMEKVEKRQTVEKKKMKRRHKEDEEDLDKDEMESDHIKLMKKHVKQKLSVLHGDRIKLTDEVVKIETEFAEERALDIKKQEEELAAMLAAQQLEKANEIAKINEQQRAIETLKNNLLNNLANHYVISDPESEEIIARHQKEKERLYKKQHTERTKQEKVLNEKLTERRKLMEAQLVEKHEQEIERVMLSSKSKAAAKFTRAMLINQHMVEREKFKNRLEKETDQTLEDIRQGYDLRKHAAAQKLEIQFISGLIRLGKVERTEIIKLLRSICPLKSELEIAELFEHIYNSQQ